MSTNPNALPHVDQPTSTAAAEAMVEGALKVRLRVLDALVTLEPAGSTADEMQQRLRLKHQSNSPRFTELADDKLIYDTGDQRPTRSGHRAIVYRPTELGISAITAQWYLGGRISKERRVSHVEQLRQALTEALQGWANSTSDSAQLGRIAELKPLTQPSSRRRA